MGLHRKADDFSTRSRRLKLFERRRAVLLLSAISAIFFSIENGLAAECLRDDRTVKFPDGSTRMRSYVCKLQNSDTPQLRVEFHRLSEASAGGLLLNLPSPGVETVIGKPKLLKTDVGTEAKKIFDEFGSKQLVSSCFGFTVGTPKGGTDYNGKDCVQRMLVFFNMPQISSLPLPLPDDDTYIKNKTAWPPNYNFFYKSSKDCVSEIECTVIWRPASISDLDNYKQNWDRYSKLGNIPNDNRTFGAFETNLQKYFKLAKYLMRDGWQNDFMTVTATYDACGGYIFVIYPRELILDVVTIENISPVNLDIDGLMVSENSGTALRKAKSLAINGGNSTTTMATKTELKPREKALVPLRMTWAVAPDLREAFADTDAANRQYAQLRKKASGTVFNLKVEKTIRKTRDSFGAPSVPSMDDFVYGPTLDLTGLVVKGETVSFAERSRNFLQATVINQDGSCPFLYAWHPKTQSWIWYGKVIHEANSKAREMTQEIPLTSFSTRFRLSEEELELSHID